MWAFSVDKCPNASHRLSRMVVNAVWLTAAGRQAVEAM